MIGTQGTLFAKREGSVMIYAGAAGTALAVYLNQLHVFTEMHYGAIAGSPNHSP